jgi:hypothetical protein
VIKGLANVLGTDPSLHAAARQALVAAEFLSAGRAATREGRHVAALRGWLDGRFSDVVTLWEEILLEWPHDALAMFAADAVRSGSCTMWASRSTYSMEGIGCSWFVTGGAAVRGRGR